MQAQGCTALIDLCDNGTDATGRDRAQFAVDVGVLEIVVAAMRAHPHADMQVRGCKTLINVCFGPDAAGPARRQRAADAGALEVVLAAMRAHPQVRVHVLNVSSLVT